MIRRRVAMGLGMAMVLASMARADDRRLPSWESGSLLDIALVSDVATDTAWDRPLMPVFEQTAAEENVPLEILLTLAKLGSGFEDRGAEPTLERGYGITALRDNAWGGDSLILAAQWLGEDVERLKVDPVTNIRGAAAVLDQYAREAGLDPDAGLEAWVPVVIRFAGLDADSSRLFAAELYEQIIRGFSVTNASGETFILAPTALDLDPRSIAGPMATPLTSDYIGAVWLPAAACNMTAVYRPKSTVVIHMLDGTAAGACAWYRDCAAEESMNYVVSEVGTIWQMVREYHIAWHAGCAKERTIAIAHEGYTAAAEHPTALYEASAFLCREICEGWGIPKTHVTGLDAGIMGHDDLNDCCCGGQETDPGPGWDWGHYMELIVGPPPEIVSARSSKEHGSAGPFEIDLEAGAWIEPRAGGVERIVVSFDQPIQLAQGWSGNPVQVSGAAVLAWELVGANLTVDLETDGDGRQISIAFAGIANGNGATVTETLAFAVRQGDINGDETVGLPDLIEVRSHLGPVESPADAACDVNLDGAVNVFDFLTIRIWMYAAP